MKTKRMKLWMVLVPALLLAAAAPRARADEDDDDDNVTVVQDDDENRAQEERDRQQEERDRQRDERDRQREERERQREQARQQAEEQREQARQQAEEARQRAEEDKQRIKEEKERAKEEKERAKEELKRSKEEKQHGRDEHECHGHDDDCDQMGGGGNHDKKSGRTSAKVKGPVRFSVEVVNADVQVNATGKDTVSITAKNCAPDDLELDGDDDEFEADFSEWGSCEGPVVVNLPAGSSVEVTTVQGSLKLKGTYKEIEASSVAGSIDIESGDDVQAEAVQGKVHVGSARRAHIESVAGDVDFTTTGTSPIVEIETVNGNVRWNGACAKGCRASIETFQGSIMLSLDPKASSFELRFATQSGKFNDGLGTTTTSKGKNVKGYAPVRAKYGNAEGTVRVESYQGGLELKKKP